MSERYSKLFALSENLYSVGAPVVLAAGALLKDNQTGKVLAQIKLQNITDQAIKAATVRITPLDTVGKLLGTEVEHQYLDLNAERDTDFGAKEPVTLPSPATRAFSVAVTEVIFSDNSVWKENNAPWEPLSAPLTPENAFEDGELAKQYKIKYGSSCKYTFKSEKDLWYCTCGALNHQGEALCHKCQKEASALAVIDLNALKADRDQRLALERKQAAAAKAKSQRTKKTVIVVAVAVALAAAIGVFMMGNAKKNAKYSDAAALVTAGDYDKATYILQKLGDYKDASSYLEYCQAMESFNSSDFETAQGIFESLGDFLDASTYAEKCKQVVYRPVKMEGAGDRYTLFSYDSAGRCIEKKTVTSRWSVTYQYTYDQNGLCVKESESYDQKPPTRIANYTYNSQGQKIQMEEVFSDGNTQITEYSYDDKNRIVSEQPWGVDGTKKYLYTYTYDAEDNYKKERIDADTGVLNRIEHYKFDANGNVTLFSWENLNANGTVSDNGVFEYTYDFDEKGNILKRYESGELIESFEYDFIFAPDAK